MQKIKVAFKVLGSKSKVETILIKLVNDTTANVSHEKHLEPLIDEFRHHNISDNGENIYEIFNSYLKGCRSWIPTFKLLYSSHELINSVGKRFSLSFLDEYFENINDLMKVKNDIEANVNGILAANYYNFLIIYAKYYPDIKLSANRSPMELLKYLKENNYIALVQLATFRNIIKYFAKVHESVLGSLNVSKECAMTNKIRMVLMRDVIAVYNLISKNLEVLMPYIFELEDTLALLLDELYSDFIKLTTKVKEIVDKTLENGVYNIPDVHYYVFDANFNRDEELFIVDIKKSRNKNDPTPYQDYMQEYQTLKPGRRLYKFNTNLTTFTKITETHTQPRQSEHYYNLASPDPSHLEDESFAHIKHNEESVYPNQINVLPMNLIETGSAGVKDNSLPPTKFSIAIPNSRYSKKEEDDYKNAHNKDFQNKYRMDSPDRNSPGSVIFTPKTFTNPNFAQEENSASNNGKPKSIFFDESPSSDVSPNKAKPYLNFAKY